MLEGVLVLIWELDMNLEPTLLYIDIASFRKSTGNSGSRERNRRDVVFKKTAILIPKTM